MAQIGRATAIRGSRYKYIVHHDRTGGDREEFYDLLQDPLEEHNLVSTVSDQTFGRGLGETGKVFGRQRATEESAHVEVQAKLEECRSEFAAQERDAVEFQFRYAISRFRNSARFLFSSDETSPAKTILILGSCQPTYLELLVKSIQMFSPQCHIDALLEEEVPVKSYQSRYRVIDNGPKKLTWETFRQQYPAICARKYDLVILPLDNVAGKGYTQIFRLARKLKKRRLVVVDYNMNIYYRHTRKWWFPLRVLVAKRRFYIQEPLLLLMDVYNSFIKPIRPSLWK
jgi:hypothetical protein